MTEISAILFIAGLFIALVDWRKGMLLCVAVGFLMDPIRKIIEGQPVYLVIGVGVFVATTILGFHLKNGHFRLRHLGELYRNMKVPMFLFVALLGFQSVVSFVNYGSPVLVGLGLLSYLAPIPGFLIAFYYGLNTNNVVQFIKFYVIFSLLMLSGIFLSYYGLEWEVLEEIGVGVMITTDRGTLNSFPGFLRSTEIAAWHAGAAISFMLVLSVSNRLGWPKLIVAALILALLVAGLLTGRRKMLMEVVIFVSVYGLLLTWFKQGASKLILIGLFIALLIGIVGTFEMTDKATNSQFDPYLHRGSTVFGDAEERFSVFGLNTVGWAINRFGYFGGGLGVATQGAQHFGGGGSRFGGAGEGGLGKIVAELGLPGLLLAAWLALALFSYLWKKTKELSRHNIPIVKVYYGLIAFLVANVPLFIVATQVFGDLFVLLILGWVLGFAVAIAQVVTIAEQANVRAANYRENAVAGSFPSSR